MKTIQTNPIIFLFIFLFSLFSCTLSAQTRKDITSGLLVLPSYDPATIEERINAQLEACPQEKIHLHTDRDVYVSGEKIWFKAYVVDANSHLFPTFSQYVYVELISPVDTLIKRVMIRQTDGMFYGHLPLSEIVPDGNYTLRAYTRYMENMDDNYFFKKNIRIENLSSVKNQLQQAAQRSRSKSAPAEKEDFEVSFFPEGGNLLEGVLCKTAFKAINKNGYPETVTGEITDENGAEFISVKTYHAGMGVFQYTPESGKRLYLKCRNENGFEKRFELPQPDPHSYSLAALMRGNKIVIGLRKSIHAPEIPCYLMVHCRGNVIYFLKWDNRYEAVTLTEEQLPAGVVQFVLFDQQMNPLSERLIFNKNDDASAKVEFHTNKEEYEKRDKVIATVFLPDSLFYSFDSHYSIAVTDDQDIAVDESTTIFSSFLLSSELKGYIENPAYYLQDDVAMDHLMQTHGWRRYNIPEVMKGNLEQPQIPFQIFQKISGKVETLNRNAQPVTDSEILIMQKGGGFGITSTDANGSFTVPELIFPDSSTFYIQALNQKGRDNVHLIVDNESFPELIYAPQSPIPANPVAAAEVINETAFMEKAEQRAKFDEDIWTIHINEVKITAPKIERKDETRLQVWQNKASDVTIRREDFEKNSPRMVYETIRNIAGVYVSPNGIISIRGSGYLPLVIIDGISAEWPDAITSHFDSPLESVNIHDVESVDVFKGISASLFGVRGAGGVISITTKRGIDDIREVERTRDGRTKLNNFYFTPLGYQKPAEFYSPKYETLEAKRSVIPDYRTTIFWKPDVVISEDGKATFEFYTSDFKTTYSVVIEGITQDGRMVRQIEKIRVELH